MPLEPDASSIELTNDMQVLLNGIDHETNGERIAMELQEVAS